MRPQMRSKFFSLFECKQITLQPDSGFKRKVYFLVSFFLLRCVDLTKTKSIFPIPPNIWHVHVLAYFFMVSGPTAGLTLLAE